jgi:hypothetical protein
MLGSEASASRQGEPQTEPPTFGFEPGVTALLRTGRFAALLV